MRDVLIPPHTFPDLAKRQGVINIVLPCLCRPEVNSLDGPPGAFRLEAHVQGEAPYRFSGVPCGCGSGRTYTVELNGAEIRWYA